MLERLNPQATGAGEFHREVEVGELDVAFLRKTMTNTFGLRSR